jgi:peptide/nickel transport system ATP-binding protein
MMSNSVSPFLSVSDLRVQFSSDDGTVNAVNGVSFDVSPGEVLAIVGESGSGKSVSSLALMGLLAKNATVTGSILWQGTELVGASPATMKQVRAKQIAMVFQDPLSAMNPVIKVGRQIAEVLRLHEGMNKRQADKRAVELLDLVGIPQPADRANAYPHEYSGGMRQRAMIAMAIACGPQLLIADEPTTALDVTVQAQVLEVLVESAKKTNAAIVLITHDLGVVAGMADRVMVMYAGQQVEIGTANEVFYNQSHPYTQGLFDSLPRLNDESELTPIAGAPPSMLRLPSGCAFHPRCPHADNPGRCTFDTPSLHPVGLGMHQSACHFSDRLARNIEVTVQ